MEQFQTVGDRLMRLLGEEALARLPTVVEGEVVTPCGVAPGYVDRRVAAVNHGNMAHSSGLLMFILTMFRPGPPVCVVSIVRSGDILQEAVRCSDT